MLLALLLLLALAGRTYGECANGCNGHGRCTSYDMCICNRNWQANDCSERVCMYGLAHVDTPKGDLDMSGTVTGPDHPVVDNSFNYPYGTTEQFPQMEDTDLNVLPNSAHYYMECSNKGTCDRSSGECTCFDGYDGVACQRASCPSSAAGVCSGHGVCLTAAQIASYDNSNQYQLWDKASTMGCKCDAGYFGPSCAQKQCKYGVDPLYLDDSATVKYSTWDFATLTTAPAAANTETPSYYYTPEGVLLNDGTAAGGKGYWAIRFFDAAGEDWVTAPIAAGATCSQVVSALEALPNNVVPAGNTWCTRSWNVGQQDDEWSTTGGLADGTTGSTLYDAQHPATSAHPYKINYRMSIWEAYAPSAYEQVGEGGLYTPLVKTPGSFSKKPVVTAWSTTALSTAVNYFTTDSPNFEVGMLLTKLTAGTPAVIGVATRVDLAATTIVTKGTASASSAALTVGSATGIVAGMTVYGNGIPASTTVSSVNGLVVTLSAAATFAISSVSVSFKAASDSYTVSFAGTAVAFLTTNQIVGQYPSISGTSITATGTVTAITTTTAGFKSGMYIAITPSGSRLPASSRQITSVIQGTSTVEGVTVTSYTLTVASVSVTYGDLIAGFDATYTVSGVVAVAATSTAVVVRGDLGWTNNMLISVGGSSAALVTAAAYAPAVTTTASTASAIGSTTIVVAAYTGIVAGMLVTGPGITSGQYVTDTPTITTVTLSAPIDFATRAGASYTFASVTTLTTSVSLLNAANAVGIKISGAAYSASVTGATATVGAVAGGNTAILSTSSYAVASTTYQSSFCGPITAPSLVGFLTAPSTYPTPAVVKAATSNGATGTTATTFVVAATGTSGENAIKVVNSYGISVGQTVSGTGIGFSATVASVSGLTVTLSVVNSAAVTTTNAITFTASATVPSTTLIIGSVTAGGFTTGQTVQGAGIPEGTTITCGVHGEQAILKQTSTAAKYFPVAGAGATSTVTVNAPVCTLSNPAVVLTGTVIIAVSPLSQFSATTTGSTVAISGVLGSPVVSGLTLQRADGTAVVGLSSYFLYCPVPIAIGSTGTCYAYTGTTPVIGGVTATVTTGAATATMTIPNSGIVPGMTIDGANVAAGTVLSVSGATTVTMAAAAITTATAYVFTVPSYTAAVYVGSTLPAVSLTTTAVVSSTTTLTFSSTTGVSVGQTIAGPGIPAGATVSSVNSTTIVFTGTPATVLASTTVSFGSSTLCLTTFDGAAAASTTASVSYFYPVYSGHSITNAVLAPPNTVDAYGAASSSVTNYLRTAASGLVPGMALGCYTSSSVITPCFQGTRTITGVNYDGTGYRVTFSGAAEQVSVYTTGSGSNAATTVVVASSAGIAVGNIVTGTNINSGGAYVTAISGNTITVSAANGGAVSGTLTFSNWIVGTNVPPGETEVTRASLTGYIYRIKLYGNPGKLKQPEIVTHLDGKRNSLMSVNYQQQFPGTNKDYRVITKVWTDGQQGEDNDYVANHCDGVQVTIGNKWVSTIDGIVSVVTDPTADQNHNTQAKFFLSSLTATEKALLKKCLGSSDFDVTNNKDVYNWDWGYDETQFDHPIRFPHLIKLVRSVTTYTDGGYYAALYYVEGDNLDSLGSGGTFYLLNPFSPPDAFATDSYEVYTTTGVLALTSSSIAASFGFGSKTIYTVDPREDPTRGTASSPDYASNGETTSGSTIVTGITSTTTIVVGMYVSGPGIPANTQVESVDSATEVTLTIPVQTGSGPVLSGGGLVALYFTTAGNGDLSCEFGLSDSPKSNFWENNNIKTLTSSTTQFACLNKTDIITLINPDFPAMNPPHINLYTVTRLQKTSPTWSNAARWGPPSTSNVYTGQYYNMGNAMTYMTNQISVDIATNWGASVGSRLQGKFGSNPVTNGGLAESSSFRVYKFYPDKTSTYNYVAPCSNRGICDHGTGLCSCFPGYTNDDCHVQSSLAL